MSALRALLAGIVDYAGLFPPAALDMASAVRNYAAYRTDSETWMLGRFVVPVARLAEFADLRTAATPADGDVWRLTALLGADTERDVAAAREFNGRHAGRSSIDALEAKVFSAEDVERAANAVRGEFALFVELPDRADPAPLVGSMQRAGVCGKIRTGGVTADAIPTPAAVVRFIRCCLDAGVAFKATAGLHHPIRAEYRLTYDANAPRGVMYGYLNVFIASALMFGGLTDADAVRVLEERDTRAFQISEREIAWRGHVVSTEMAARVRGDFALSFGSCSFREPVDELQALFGT